MAIPIVYVHALHAASIRLHTECSTLLTFELFKQLARLIQRRPARCLHSSETGRRLATIVHTQRREKGSDSTVERS